MTTVDGARTLIGRAVESFTTFRSGVDEAAGLLALQADDAARAAASSRMSRATISLDQSIGALSGARFAEGLPTAAREPVEQGFKGLLELQEAAWKSIPRGATSLDAALSPARLDEISEQLVRAGVALA